MVSSQLKNRSLTGRFFYNHSSNMSERPEKQTLDNLKNYV